MKGLNTKAEVNEVLNSCWRIGELFQYWFSLFLHILSPPRILFPPNTPLPHAPSALPSQGVCLESSKLIIEGQASSPCFGSFPLHPPPPPPFPSVSSTDDWFIEDQAFSPSYCLTPPSRPPYLSRQQDVWDVSLSQSSCVSPGSSLLKGEGRGANSYNGEKVWHSIIH